MTENGRNAGRYLCVATLGAALLVPVAGSAQTVGPQLKLDHLARLAAQATNTVDVTLDPAMLQMAAGLLTQQAAANPAIKELLAGLKGVYVKVFEFDRDGVYTAADLDAIRTQFTGAWRRYVSLQEKTESVEIYGFQEGDVPGGLAIVVAEPRELTVVNIVGIIDLTKLAALAGQFGIPSIPGLPGMPAPR